MVSVKKYFKECFTVKLMGLCIRSFSCMTVNSIIKNVFVIFFYLVSIQKGKFLCGVMIICVNVCVNGRMTGYVKCFGHLQANRPADYTSVSDLDVWLHFLIDYN